MFKNELTRKMPCWDCTKNNDCRIQDGVCSIPFSATTSIVGLTFVCLAKKPLSVGKQEEVV